MVRLVLLLMATYALATQDTTAEEVTSKTRKVEDSGRRLAQGLVDATSLSDIGDEPGTVQFQVDDEERGRVVWPASTGLVLLTRPRYVSRGNPFNGGMRTYKRSNMALRPCSRMTVETAVFVVRAGGVLSNVIIASGGVFCETNNCALENVWFKNSLQGGLHINSGTGITTITGGGAKNVPCRVIFGQSSGTAVISGGFYMKNSGRLFESCPRCGPVKRGVIVDGVINVNPTDGLISMNSNYNDRGTITKATIITTSANYPVCTWSIGGVTPKVLGSGIFPPVCSYTEASVTIRPP